MHLAWLSDIHLNFLGKNTVLSFAKRVANSIADAVVITGDIAEHPSFLPIMNLLEQTIRKPIYFINGNHDFYRGSIANQKQNSIELSNNSEAIYYLEHTGPIELTDKTCLVGVDGFYDGRYGDFFGLTSGGWDMNGYGLFRLADFDLIEEISVLSGRDAQYQLFNNLGDQGADLLKSFINQAAPKYKNILIATHIPPFAEVSKYNGNPSPINSLPFFSCKALGEMLLDIKERYPNNNFHVICGHSHFEASLTIDNLYIEVARAEYYQPAIYKIIDVE